jgi:hypothetical protein
VVVVGDEEPWGQVLRGGGQVLRGGGRVWDRPRCHSSFAYSCLGNYLSKYIWFIGAISNSFAIMA